MEKSPIHDTPEAETTPEGMIPLAQILANYPNTHASKQSTMAAKKHVLPVDYKTAAKRGILVGLIVGCAAVVGFVIVSS